MIQELAPQQRAVYELSRSEGLKINEIAERLSISPNAVKTVLQTVLKLIKEKLTAAGYWPFACVVQDDGPSEGGDHRIL